MLTIQFFFLLGICFLAPGALADEWCNSLLCPLDPCEIATCPLYGDAECICSGCTARFILNGQWLSTSDCTLGGGRLTNALTNVNPGFDVPDFVVGGGRMRLQNMLRSSPLNRRRFGSRPFGTRPFGSRPLGSRSFQPGSWIGW